MDKYYSIEGYDYPVYCISETLTCIIMNDNDVNKFHENLYRLCKNSNKFITYVYPSSTYIIKDFSWRAFYAVSTNMENLARFLEYQKYKLGGLSPVKN